MPQRVKEFLLAFKEVGSAKGINLPLYREETRPAMEHLGLTRRNVEELLLSLSVENYSKGPEKDRDRDGEIWVFGCGVGDEEVYIKLKLVTIGETSITKCISFHLAEFPLKYPFKPEHISRG